MRMPNFAYLKVSGENGVIKLNRYILLIGITVIFLVVVAAWFSLRPREPEGILATNGIVLYGTVADFVSPHRVARAFGLFYTFLFAASAVSPPIMGRISDMLGVENSIRLIGCIALSSLPMALVLWRQTVKSGKESKHIQR